MSGDLRAYIELRGFGVRGPRYQVRMNKPDGMVIIAATTEPLFDAARVLLSKGIKGRLEVWDAQRQFPRLAGDIETLAGLKVSETQDGITLRRYVGRASDLDNISDDITDVDADIAVISRDATSATPSAKQVADIGTRAKSRTRSQLSKFRQLPP